VYGVESVVAEAKRFSKNAVLINSNTTTYNDKIIVVIYHRYNNNLNEIQYGKCTTPGHIYVIGNEKCE